MGGGLCIQSLCFIVLLQEESEVMDLLRFKSSLVIFLFSVLLLLPAAMEAHLDIMYCSQRSYPVSITDVQIEPYPVTAGSTATFTIKARTGEIITGGKLKLVVLLLGVRVHSETYDICDKVACPISIGKFRISHTQTLPGITPSGVYKLKMTITDEKRTQLTCISFKFNIGHGPHQASII